MELDNTLNFKKEVYESKIFSKRNPKIAIYVLAFLYTIHLTPASYVSSIFLEQFVKTNYIGYIFAAGSFATIICLIFNKRILRKIGNYKSFMSILFIEIISLLLLSLSLVVEINTAWILLFIAAFTVGTVTRIIGFVNLDIFLEHYSDNKQTGGIRGIFLTSLNLAFVFGPIIASFLVTAPSNTGRVFLLGAVIAAAVMIFTYTYLRDFKDIVYDKSHLLETYARVFKNSNLLKIFIISIILNLFYAIMVIYIPVYLNGTIGFSIKQIGLIMAIALVPFVLFQAPFGRIADKILGEKELLITGTIIMGLSTFLIGVLDIENFWFWAMILFISRLGASAIEIMSETHLFKKIDADDIDILSLFRINGPLAYLIAPVAASIFLLFLDLNLIFAVLGVVVLISTFSLVNLKDTL